MDVSTDRAKLHNTMRDLRALWHDLQEVWDDPVRRDFEKTYVDALEARVLAATRAMDQLAHILHEVRNQCS